MSDSKFNRAFESTSTLAETAVKGHVVGSFLINIAVSGSLSQILGMINSLQLIVHLPLFAVSVPANVMTMFEILVPIVMFDILDTDDLFKVSDQMLGTKFMEKIENEGDWSLIPDQIQNLGYDESSPVLNLGTMAYFTGFYFLKVMILAIIVGPIKHYTGYGQGLLTKMYQKLFFGEILLIIIEGYLDFNVSLFLYEKFDPYKNDLVASQDGFAEFCKYFIILLVFFIAPLTLIYIIR